MSTQWKYKVVELKSAFFGDHRQEAAQAELDRLGAMGWELVSVVQTNAADAVFLYLKQPA